MTQANNKVPLAAGLGVAALIAVFIGYRAMPRSEAPRPANRSQETNWLKQKAAEVQGDFTRLSQEDQQKLRQMYGSQIESGFRMMYQKPPQ